MAETIATVGELAGMCGHDGTNWEKVLIDASKRLVVAVASAIASDVQLHGYFSGAWQKAPIPFGISDTVSGAVIEDNLDAGNNNLDGVTVPEGEVWVVTTIGGYYKGAVATGILLKCHVGGVVLNLKVAYPPTSEEWYVITGQFVMKEDDFCRVRIEGAAAGDDGQLRYGGYKIDVDL